MKILNLYAGIGGNRKLWDGDITAIEYIPEIAEVYQDLYPNDKVIVGDAHEYLLRHYAEYDFIWSSPPCPSHSRLNTTGLRETEYPDMRLYQEIILLQKYFKRKYVVENVIPFYEPLIPCAYKIDRHLFWSNIKLLNHIEVSEKRMIKCVTLAEERYGFNLAGTKIKDKRKVLRNLVDPAIAYEFYLSAKGIKKVKQNELF